MFRNNHRYLLLGITLLVIQLFTGCVQATPTQTPITTSFPEGVATNPLKTFTPALTMTPSTLEILPTSTRLSKRSVITVPFNCFPEELSSDSEWLTMICATTDTLKVRKVATGEVVTLFDRVGSESFSPDGQKLAMATYDEEGDKHSIWLYTIGEWQTPKLLLSYASIFRPSLIWSPDSQSIAIPYLEEGFALSNLYLDGTHKNLLTYDDVQYDYAPGGRFNMSWSPDGKKILYTTYTENDPLQSLSQAIRLRVVDVVTGQKELLFSGKPGEAAFFPIWSPNGRLITFQPSRLEKYMRVYFFDLENKTLMGIGDFPNGYSAAWSPDSKHLAVCSTWLYIITVATGQIDDLGETCSSFLSWQGNSRVIVQQNYVLYAISIP